MLKNEKMGQCLLLTEPGSWRARSNQRASKPLHFASKISFSVAFIHFGLQTFDPKKIQNFRFLGHLDRPPALPLTCLQSYLVPPKCSKKHQTALK